MAYAQSQSSDSISAVFANAQRALLSAFDKYEVVGGVSPGHGVKDVDDFVIALIRNPELPNKVTDIAVECGNSLSQDILDQYIAGQDVPLSAVLPVWRNTTQPNCGFSTLYEEILSPGSPDQRRASTGKEAPRVGMRSAVLQIAGGEETHGILRVGMSCSDAVKVVYEPDLPHHIVFRQPADLTLSDHVHRLISRDRVQRPVDRSKPKAGGDSLLDETMILFQDIIQVGRWPAAAPPSQFTRLLQFRNGGGIGGMAVHVDHSGPAGGPQMLRRMK